MQVLCRPEGRLTERLFCSTIIKTLIVYYVFSWCKTSGLEKMHVCILIAIMSLRFHRHHFPGTNVFAWHSDKFQKGPWSTVLKSLITFLWFSFHTKKKKRRVNKNLCVIALIGRNWWLKRLGWYSRLFVSYVSKASCFSFFPHLQLR